MFFRGIHFISIKSNRKLITRMSIARISRPPGIKNCPDGQFFLFEPTETGGISATPLSSPLPNVAPPKEIIKMNSKGIIQIPTLLIKQLRDENSMDIVILGIMEGFEMYSLKTYEDVMRSIAK